MSDSIPVLIVPTLNGHERLQDMLESVDYPIDQVIVVDNGGTDYQWVKPDWVDTLDVIRLPSNLGVAGSWNLGIKSSPFADYWLIVNDDVTFAPGSLARFALEGGTWLDAISLCNDQSPWCAFTIGQEVVTVVGLFDEAYYPAYFEDDEYARRAMEMMGVDIVYYTGIAVNHANSSTINSGFSEANHRTYLANQALWQGKQLSASRFDPIGWQLDIRRANDWGI